MHRVSPYEFSFNCFLGKIFYAISTCSEMCNLPRGLNNVPMQLATSSLRRCDRVNDLELDSIDVCTKCMRQQIYGWYVIYQFERCEWKRHKQHVDAAVFGDCLQASAVHFSVMFICFFLFAAKFVSLNARVVIPGLQYFCSDYFVSTTDDYQTSTAISSQRNSNASVIVFIWIHFAHTRQQTHKIEH